MANRFVLPRLPRATLPALITIAVLALAVQNASAQSSWNGGTGNWNLAGNWTPSGVPNSSSTDVYITGTSTTASVVTLDNLSASVHNLSLDQYSTLSILGTQNINIYGSSIANAGQIQAGNDSDIFLIGSGATFNLTGAGTLSLGASNTVLEGYFGNENLVNQGNTIEGQGSIKYLASFNNQTTVNANVSGGTLTINSINNVKNTGTLEATGGGTLYINSSTVNNAGGTIYAGPSSTVTFYGATINGGNLSSASSGVIQGLFTDTLNGVTITSGSTYFLNNNNTYLTGDLTNKGTVIVGNSSADSGLLVQGTVANNGTINLSGGGTINLNNAGSEIEGVSGNETLVNHDNLIQGQGSIAFLSSFNNQATVNSNVSGETLTINSINNVTNTGTLEATGGGTLYINSSTVNNAGGTIYAGPSSNVTLYAATINGGNLSSASSGVIQGRFTDTLNGVTITSGSTYFLNNNNTYLTGDLTNKGTVIVGNSSADSGLLVQGTVANNGTINLSGGGTINLNNAGSEIEGGSGNETLVNHDNLIQGQGSIAFLGSFNNQATVDANVSGETLTINSINNVTNTGTLEATGGGTLRISDSTVTNTGGTISTDSSSSVIITASTIIGGNLTSASGAVIHGVDSFLSGVTITSGSTYSVDPNTSNFLSGDLINKGTVVIGGAGASSNSSDLAVYASTVNLSGGGTIVLNNASSQLDGYYGNETLVNKDNIIQGQGYIEALASFTNGGTVNANVSGGTLFIDYAPTTNTGTLEAQAGATLNLNNTTLTNFASTGATAGTLSGGTYQVWSGTLSFNNGNYTNDIVTNAATILLDGASGTPNFIDQNGNNALAHIATNAAAGSFTIQNGVSVTSDPSTDFHNAGTMNIGATSTFTVGGGHDYTQSGGLTYLQAATSDLVAHTININGGTLQGFGTVTGNLVNGGIVHPGDGPGILSVTGNYTQTSSGILDIQIGGPNAGTGYSQLSITGTAALGGTLDVSLFNGFTPYNGETFTILTSGGLNSSVFSEFNGLQEGNVTFTVAYTSGDVILDAIVPQSVPEPASLVMLGIGIAGLGAYVVRRRRHASQGCIAN